MYKKNSNYPHLIIATQITNYEQMRKDLLQRNLVFNATLLNNDEVKINTATLDIKWHTYENRPIKVMVRNLHPTCKADKIAEVL